MLKNVSLSFEILPSYNYYYLIILNYNRLLSVVLSCLSDSVIPIYTFNTHPTNFLCLIGCGLVFIVKIINKF